MPISPSPFPKFRMAGEDGIIIEFGDSLHLATNAQAIQFDAYLQSLKPPYILESMAILRSAYVRYDALQIAYDDMVQQLQTYLKQVATAQNTTHKAVTWSLPVCYQGEYAPDIASLAEAMNISIGDVIGMHRTEILQILMLGFAPGWIYAGILPPRWNVPRLPKAKPNVPAGSLSVAVRQTVISATTAPTGWRTIGRTPFINFDLHRDPPVTMLCGHKIKIEPISPREFLLLQKDFAAGRKTLSRLADVS